MTTNNHHNQDHNDQNRSKDEKDQHEMAMASDEPPEDEDPFAMELTGSKHQTASPPPPNREATASQTVPPTAPSPPQELDPSHKLPVVELRPATEAQIDQIDVRTEALMDLLKPTFQKEEDPLVDAIMRILAEIRLIREDQRHQGQMLSLILQRQEFLAGGAATPQPRTPAQHQTAQ